MLERVLVTGVNGFVGKHLARALSEAQMQVDGVVREERIDPSIEASVNQTINCDLVDENQVRTLDLSAYKAIIHLAGLAKVVESFKKPDLYMNVNAQPLVNICEALLAQKALARVIAISSGAVYDSHEPMPLNESSKTNPHSSPYAKSKLEMEDKAHRYIEQGVDCVIVRPFNHIGPGQMGGFLLPDLADQVKNAIGTGEPVRIGNLKTRRDYTDVRDVVKAYASLVSAKLNHKTYNVCSGRSYSGQEILDMIIKNLGAEHLKIVEDPALMRPNDAMEIYGSYGRLKNDTGWQPQIPIEQTIKDVLI
jgi:GDP-4-dehydro-6-deoxy-D-mannose reductase